MGTVTLTFRFKFVLLLILRTHISLQNVPTILQSRVTFRYLFPLNANTYLFSHIMHWTLSSKLKCGQCQCSSWKWWNWCNKNFSGEKCSQSHVESQLSRRINSNSIWCAGNAGRKNLFLEGTEKVAIQLTSKKFQWYVSCDVTDHDSLIVL